ncbi:MAG TPA: Shedu immune nuclease family protein [Chthoniobacterales bacterium]|nr:Shedu immune nuclease family protein [Chthoniobacterales bacterium]
MRRQLDAHDTSILAKFQRLLNARGKEQVLQKYLENHPRLIPQEFVQNHGVHFSVILRKLELAENYATDFFYLSKSSGDWNAVFVELEKPQSRFFNLKKPDAFHKDFHTALEQLNKWRAWTKTNGNMRHLLAETLEPIWQPKPMRHNPVYPKYVLVMGRRSEYSSDDKRGKLIHSVEADDFKILSFDSLIDGYASNEDVYVAKRCKSKLEIISRDYIGEDLFAWVDPTRLRIPKALADDAQAHRRSWRYLAGAKNLREKKLDAILPKIEQVSTAKRGGKRRP